MTSLKVVGPLLVLLFPLREQLVKGQNLSRKEFMIQHYLKTTLEFSQYNCDVLMKEREPLRGKASHVFLYAPWHQIEYICLKTWTIRYRNMYVWGHQPFRILECKRQSLQWSYKERRSYSHVEFHCSTKGYVDSIEDVRVLQFIDI
ncbi:epididymal secretory protein E3-beta [Tenrec ecaudatus]|uniref:epididymal secretory protein E3-beta n=1 Tax=Tenrec ecaudatus TaxID=94439 RepID=UPI003F5A0D26